MHTDVPDTDLREKMLRSMYLRVPNGTWEAAQQDMYMLTCTTLNGHTIPYIETNEMRNEPLDVPEETVIRVFPTFEDAAEYKDKIQISVVVSRLSLEELFLRASDADLFFRQKGMGPIRIDMSLMLPHGAPRTMDVLFTSLAERH